jgi:hypothetical protein
METKVSTKGYHSERYRHIPKRHCMDHFALSLSHNLRLAVARGMLQVLLNIDYIHDRMMDNLVIRAIATSNFFYTLVKTRGTVAQRPCP